MHPIERLRYVARASGVDSSLLAREAAEALAGVVQVEPAGLVPACRRLVGRHLAIGPIWWLAARVLTAPDPVRAAWAAAAALDGDPTAGLLAAALPDDITVTIVGWPDIVAGVLRRRGDLEVLVADATGAGSALALRLVDAGAEVAVVPDSGLAAAVMVSDLVVVEATAGGPSGIVATSGSHAAASVATQRSIPVWAVAGVGRVLPKLLWDGVLQRLDGTDLEPWDRAVELVPASVVSHLAGPAGLVGAADGLADASCPEAPELLRNVG